MNTKIIIDERKLQVLIRLGVDEHIIFEKIQNPKKILKTGDKLVDSLLLDFCVFKEFAGWGGNHNPSGKNQYSKEVKIGQLDRHLAGQVVDIDKDIDKDKDKDKECVKYKKVNSNIPLDCSVKEALEKWLSYKKERNQSYKPTGLKACIEKLERLSNNDSALAMRIVEESISNNWSGLFPLKDKKSIGQSINEKNWKIIQDTFGLEEENADIR